MADEIIEQQAEDRPVREKTLKKVVKTMRDVMYNRKEVDEKVDKVLGLSTWQKEYLEGIQDAEVKSKMAVAVSLSPASKETVGTETAITVTATVKYDNVLVDAEVTGKDGLVFTKKSTGTYTASASYPVPTNDNGSNTKSYGASATYDLNGTKITKEASATFTLYSQCAILQTAGTALPTEAQIKAATNKRRQITGTYDIQVTAGQYVWLCVPKGLTQIKDIKSSGFGVPFEAAQSVSVTVGTQTVTYNCYRISGAPQSSPMSVVIS